MHTSITISISYKCVLVYYQGYSISIKASSIIGYVIDSVDMSCCWNDQKCVKLYIVIIMITLKSVTPECSHCDKRCRHSIILQNHTKKPGHTCGVTDCERFESGAIDMYDVHIGKNIHRPTNLKQSNHQRSQSSKQLINHSSIVCTYLLYILFIYSGRYCIW